MVRLKKNIRKINFKYIIESYIIPMLATDGQLEEIQVDTKEYLDLSHPLICFKDNKVYFYSSAQYYSKDIYCYTVRLSVDCYDKSAAERILETMLFDERYFRNSYNFSCKLFTRKKFEAFFKTNNLNLMYEIGMYIWLAGSQKRAVCIYNAINLLREWQEKTYEGKRAGFGMVFEYIDGNIDGTAYVDFLRNDESGLFADGKYTLVRLDKKGNFITFESKERVSKKKMGQFCSLYL